MSSSVFQKRPLLSRGPDTERSAVVTFVPTGSNGVIPTNQLLEDHNIASVRRLASGQYEILLVEPGLYIQNVEGTAFLSSSIGYPQVFAQTRATSGSIVAVVTGSNTLSNVFDECTVVFTSRTGF